VAVKAGQPDLVDEIVADGRLFCGGDAFLAQAEADVLAHGQPGEEGVTLEDHAAVRARSADHHVVHQHLAGGGEVEPGDDPQQGGLAAAGRAEDGDEVVVGDFQRRPLQGHRLRLPAPPREDPRDVLDRDAGHQSRLIGWRPTETGPGCRT
jgi:hypothetical protein